MAYQGWNLEADIVGIYPVVGIARWGHHMYDVKPILNKRTICNFLGRWSFGQ
jgi:hypothetical protein